MHNETIMDWVQLFNSVALIILVTIQWKKK